MLSITVLRFNMGKMCINSIYKPENRKKTEIKELFFNVNFYLNGLRVNFILAS